MSHCFPCCGYYCDGGARCPCEKCQEFWNGVDCPECNHPAKDCICNIMDELCEPDEDWEDE